jgi:hypothetical protein
MKGGTDMTKKKIGTTKIGVLKTKTPPLVVSGLVIDEKAVCALVKDANERDSTIEANRDHWKARALGFHMALLQQQKGLGRMRKKLDRLHVKIAKLEQRLTENHENGLNMALRLDAVRSVADPSTKIVKENVAGDKKYPTQPE